jgi:hypothetical protein
MSPGFDCLLPQMHSINFVSVSDKITPSGFQYFLPRNRFAICLSQLEFGLHFRNAKVTSPVAVHLGMPGKKYHGSVSYYIYIYIYINHHFNPLPLNELGLRDSEMPIDLCCWEGFSSLCQQAEFLRILSSDSPTIQL